MALEINITNTKLIRCRYCLAKNIKLITTSDTGVKLIKCLRCGLIMRDPLICWEDNFKAKKVKSFIRHYNDGEEWRRKIARQRLNLIKIFYRRGKLIDYGCATGFFIDEARKMGYQCIGVDNNVSFLKEARKRHSNIKFITPEDIGRQKIKGNIITVFDSLGYLKNLNRFVRFLNDSLLPSGILFLSTLFPDKCLAKEPAVLSFNYYLKPPFIRRELIKTGMLPIAEWQEPKNINTKACYSMDWWRLRLGFVNSVKMHYAIFRKKS